MAIVGYVAYNSRRIRRTFGRYLSDRIVATLLDNPAALELDGQRHRVTILTADLRSFTAIAERLPPEAVVRVLNVYLQPMLATIADYGGTINDLLGDGIFALFGVPTASADDAARAIACAVAMQLAMEAVNAKMHALNLPTLEMGIAINTGECIAGNIGSDLYTRYGAIGSQVNLAFHIETYAAGQQILISEATLQAVGAANLRIDGQQQIAPKGVMRPLTVYSIGGIGGAYDLFLPQHQDELFSLAAELPVLCVAIEGKQMGDRLYRGNLVRLAANSAMLAIAEDADAPDSSPFLPLNNIKFNLLAFDREGLPELSKDAYAKILALGDRDNQFYIRFTYRPPVVAVRLHHLWQQAQQRPPFRKP